MYEKNGMILCKEQGTIIMCSFRAVDCITLSQASYFKQREEQFKSRLLQKHEISLLPELRRRVGEKPDAVQTTPDGRI